MDNSATLSSAAIASYDFALRDHHGQMYFKWRTDKLYGVAQSLDESFYNVTSNRIHEKTWRRKVEEFEV
ncbi:hypothetical protein NECAME_14055 [Necator americanus]|uniref:Uncharacterized protein n=1 Tax=Necator americanus TaxID=51031 RepID=W2SQM1_NECAM|nr:hypothetical protein NECAME_14055 [Necator americanus]ETN71925.1 hypothetical protein NECAME_14055 [Necator americanus]